MIISFPDRALVMLIGPSGSGKSTFAARHFTRTEVVSSDECRALVSDNDKDMAATPAAFRVLHAITRERLRAGRVVVVDATNLLASSRQPLLAMARKYGRPAVAVALALPLELCLQRMDGRRERLVPPDAVRRQHAHLATTLARVVDEGFAEVHVLRSAEAVDSAVLVRAARSE